MSEIPKLQSEAHIHFIGICGVAMASLAGLLKEQGYKITGSDQNVYPPMSTQLKSLGIEIKEGYKKENLSPKPDLVIVGNVITRNHEEAQALLESDIPYTSLPKAMGEFLIKDKDSVVVAGTHGKTTTTSMMAWVAQVCGKDPGFLVGGITKNFNVSFQSPRGSLFVIEGDEYDTAFFDKVPKFIYYRPKFAILTSIEFDHADIYADMDEVKKAFYMLMDRLDPEGILIAHADDEHVGSVIGSSKTKKVVTYGQKKGDYKVQNMTMRKDFMEFDVVRNDQLLDRVQISVFGEYNALNAVSVYALATELDWSKEKILEGLKTYQGVKRRQEILGRPNGITVIEDFAHHPTAVAMTIDTIQSRYPEAHVYSVFEPRSAASRRKVFQKEYAKAFSQAQTALIAKPYNQEKIPPEDRFSSNQLIQDLKATQVDAHLMEDNNTICEFLKSHAKPDDVILIMSNGGFNGLYNQLLSTLI